MAEQLTNASIEAFDRSYQQHGIEVSWAKHPPAVLTDKFMAEVLKLSSRPLIYDFGGGEGGKAFYMSKSGARIIVMDASPTAISLGQQNAAALNLEDKIEFQQADLVKLDPLGHLLAEGAHDYQCINHIPYQYHQDIASKISALLKPKGVFLTNSFSRETTNFYGVDISVRSTGEFIFHYDPDNPEHHGKWMIDGMYCYFFEKSEVLELYAPYFYIKNIIPVEHPSIKGRFHWELLGTKK